MSRPCKHRIVAFEGYPSKPATSAKMTGVGNKCYTEGYIKVDSLREMLLYMYFCSYRVTSSVYLFKLFWFNLYLLKMWKYHFSTGGPPQNVLLHPTFPPEAPPKTQIFRNFSRRFPFQNLVFTPKNPHFFAKKVVLHRYTIHTSHRC